MNQNKRKLQEGLVKKLKQSTNGRKRPRPKPICPPNLHNLKLQTMKKLTRTKYSPTKAHWA